MNGKKKDMKERVLKSYIRGHISDVAKRNVEDRVENIYELKNHFSNSGELQKAIKGELLDNDGEDIKDNVDDSQLTAVSRKMSFKLLGQ